MKVTHCDISWSQGLPKIETAQLKLRAIRPEDKQAYQELFLNPIAMSGYLRGPRDISQRFDGLLNRWQWDHFCALAVLDKKTDKVIGHAVLRHGDYAGKRDEGWSEAAVVIDPSYWNKKCENGSCDKEDVGREIFHAVGTYAKHLSDKGYLVPSDVTDTQQAEVELLASKGTQVHRNEQGKIEWVYLPFTELRATAHPSNIPSSRLLHQAAERNHGTFERTSNERELFKFSLQK